jgi:hypothetical protein
MGRKSGITGGGYHPRIHKMNFVMGQREQLRAQEDLLMSKSKTSLNYWKQRFHNAVDYLKAADPNGWEAWFDDDRNVPAQAKSEDLARIVESRVIELQGHTNFPTSSLYRNIFIWRDANGFFVYSKEVGNEQLYVNEFNSQTEAESFIVSLNVNKNIGYGVVLDIIPAPALNEVNATAGK